MPTCCMARISVAGSTACFVATEKEHIFNPWGFFRRVRKTGRSGCWLRNVCLSDRTKQFGCHWMDLYEILNLDFLRRSVETVHVLLKYDKNNGYFMKRLMYIFNNVSLNSSLYEKYFRQICRENQNTHFIFNVFFRKSCRLWDNVEKSCRSDEATDDNENMAHALFMLGT